MNNNLRDTEIVSQSLSRWLIESQHFVSLYGSQYKSCFIIGQTKTIPLRVEIGPNDDWDCKFIFDLPHVHEDGAIEYRLRCEP